MRHVGPSVVTLVVLGIYAAHYMGYGMAWSDGDMRLQDTCLTLVLGYWIGSSADSARKTEILKGGQDGH